MKLLPSILLGLVVGIAQPPAYDLIIRGGHVLDGTGNPWIDADVGIRSDRIASIGRLTGVPHPSIRAWVAIEIAGAVWETLAWRAIYRPALTCGPSAVRSATPWVDRRAEWTGDRHRYAARIRRTRVSSKSRPSRHMA